MSGKYILDGKTAVEEPDLMKWADWFINANRIVRKDRVKVRVGGKEVGFIDVSTIFLGVDHSYGSGAPMLFETSVFGGHLNREMDWCSTWEAAEKMHEKMMGRVRGYLEL